jgi:hypothetical protein
MARCAAFFRSSSVDEVGQPLRAGQERVVSPVVVPGFTQSG